MAWKEFRRGKRSKQDVQKFELNLEDNIFGLHEELKREQYQHFDYTPFYITDPKLRNIHKATVRDRLVHHAIFRIIYPIFDKSFIFDSYSCRIGKGTHRGVKRLSSFNRKLSRNYTRNIYGLKCDVSRFFDSVDQKILLELIKAKISDQQTLSLIEKIIFSFEKSASKGIPLGNVTSQLFANVYLNELDQYIKRTLKIKYYLRYCDDFIILAKSNHILEKLVPILAEFLQDKLKLVLHPRKIILRNFQQGFDFLGYVVLPHHTVLRTQTKKRMFRRVNQRNLPSYLGLLQHSSGYGLTQKLLGLDKI